MTRLASRALVVLATCLLVLALVAGYVERAAFDSDQFANRATEALRDGSVRSLIATRITDEVVLAQEEDLLAARPIIESVTADLVGSSVFTGLFRAAVRDVHRTVIERGQDTFTLTVGDVGTVLAEALEQLRPGVAKDVRATERVEVVRSDLGSVGADLAELADQVRVLAIALLVLWAAATVGALALSRDRRRTAVELGVGAAAAGVLLVVGLGILGSVAADSVDGPEEQAAARAVFDAFLGDLRTAGWILAGCGAVVAAAASSYLKPAPLGDPLRRAAALIATEPRRPLLRWLRGIALVAAGVLTLVRRDAVVALVFTLVGAYLVYEGVSAMLRLVYRPPEPGAERREWRGSVRRFVPAAAAAALVVLAVGAFVGGGGASVGAPPTGACNGHRALCDKRIDELVLPSTHNAMSVPLPGWYSAEQDAPIADQLADGVRGLLLDTHYGDLLPNGRVRTEFVDRSKPQQAVSQDGVSQKTLDAGLRIRDRLVGSGEGERGLYLCHTLCEIGATPLASVLRDLHDFLVANPDEFVVVVNEDYVTPADFTKAVLDAGLGDQVYRGPVDGEWPTLREALDNGWRVLFMAENEAGAEPWYHPAFESLVEDTPYTFRSTRALTDPDGLAKTCEPNRGPADAPFLLVNHWVSTDPVPRPSDASVVNAREPLLARMRECERVRDHLPSLVAVNFYRRGDLFGVVDTLNGLR
ncbi:MAG: hypothetical protein JW895_13955 [Thermoleophilaceae bacterium]|nr:hypothetical protein [Thermoleophilaceae bacterium]